MKCPECSGEGKVVGMFPVWADDVPPEKRKLTVDLPCFLCDGKGDVDEGFTDRELEGSILRVMRIEHRLTLRAFAEKAGVATIVVSDFERGKMVKPEETVLIQMAQAELHPI